MKRGALLVFLGLVLTLGLWAQRFWDGSAAVGRYGDFPPEGHFGHSGVFPRNSIVNVMNLNTGRSVRVVITGGLSNPSLLIVVSESAAEALGLAGRDIAQVRVSPALGSAAPFPEPGFDLPYSRDPEVNPAAAAGDVNALVDKRADRAPRPAVIPEPAEDSGAAPEKPAEAREAVIAHGESRDAEPAPEEGEETPAGYGEWTNGEAPEVGPETIPAWTAGDIPVPQGPAKPEFPGGPEVSLAAAEGGGERPAPDAAEPPSVLEDEPELSGEARRSAVERLDTIVATIPDVLPEEAFPDAGTKREEAPPATAVPPLPGKSVAEAEFPRFPDADPLGTWARTNLPLTTTLVRKSYYLQVAAYSDPRKVKPVVDSLAGAYPVVVEPVEGPRPLYRVLVGPVSGDERGVALRNLRAGGYRDAFSRRVD